MPRKYVYITGGASDALTKYGVDLSEGWYDTNIGTVSALLAREGVPNAQVGPATQMARDCGCYVTDVPPSDHPDIPRTLPKKTIQPTLFDLGGHYTYNETSHLTPDGKKKR